MNQNRNIQSSKTDIEIFEGLYRRYKEVILQLLYSLVNKSSYRWDDRMDPLDLFQKTWKNIWKTIQNGNFPDIPNPEPYLLKTARNVFNDAYDECLREPDRVSIHTNDDDEGEDSWVYEVIDPKQDIHRDIEIREIERRVGDAVQSLPEDYREILIMRVYEELSYTEIAEKTGESLSNVKSIIHRARKMLKEKLKDIYNDWRDSE